MSGGIAAAQGQGMGMARWEEGVAMGATRRG